MMVDGLGAYDAQNIFAKILRGEIPCRKVAEDEFSLAFHDIAPQAPVHVLVVPKIDCVSFADFHVRASDAQIAGFFRAVGRIAKQLELEKPGYRLVANMGPDGGQMVPHFHVHIFGGRSFGGHLVARDAQAGGPND